MAAFFAPLPTVPTVAHYHPSLSGLRGLAVLYVVAAHYASLLPLPFPTNSIGKVGVWMFFGLSAYLLTTGLQHNLVNKNKKRDIACSLAAYGIHRFFRIYPLFSLCLLYHVLRNSLQPNQAGQHLLLQAGWRELWAIPVEFRYYLCIPLVCLAARLLHKKPTLLVAGLFLAPALICTFSYSGLVFANSVLLWPKILPFVLGSLLALTQAPLRQLWHNMPGPAALLHSCVTVGTALCLLLLTILYRRQTLGILPQYWAPWISLGLALCTAALLFLAMESSLARRFFSLHALVYIGKISFSIYLWHWPLLDEADRYFSGKGSLLSQPLMLIAAVFCVSSCSYLLVERPGIALGRWLSVRLPGQIKSSPG